MENSNKLILLDPQDNVLVARQEIAKGECISILGEAFEIKQVIQLGFKMAFKRIGQGEKVIKYGTPIGSATRVIHPGEMVHTHNIKSDFSPTFTIENPPSIDEKSKSK